MFIIIKTKNALSLNLSKDNFQAAQNYYLEKNSNTDKSLVEISQLKDSKEVKYLKLLIIHIRIVIKNIIKIILRVFFLVVEKTKIKVATHQKTRDFIRNKNVFRNCRMHLNIKR